MGWHGKTEEICTSTSTSSWQGMGLFVGKSRRPFRIRSRQRSMTCNDTTVSVEYISVQCLFDAETTHFHKNSLDPVFRNTAQTGRLKGCRRSSNCRPVRTPPAAWGYITPKNGQRSSVWGMESMFFCFFGFVFFDDFLVLLFFILKVLFAL